MGLSHWDKVWSRRRPEELSWYQDDPGVSRRLIKRVAAQDAAVLDVGGGASQLVDCLLDDGYTNLAVIDIASSAIETSRKRLGDRAEQIEWLVGDVTKYDFGRSFDLWHDRALLHFLVDPDSRSRYLRALKRTLEVGGHAIIATFGPEGPETCSGLPVRRYGPSDMIATLGNEFAPIDHVEEHHQTPGGTVQQFIYGLYKHAQAISNLAVG